MFGEKSDKIMKPQIEYGKFLKQEASKQTGTFSVGGAISGGVFFIPSLSLQAGIDAKGNYLVYQSVGLNFSIPAGYSLAATISISGSTANNIYGVTGEGVNAGFSVLLGKIGTAGIDVVAGTTDEGGLANIGYQISGGLGNGGDIHIGWSEASEKTNKNEKIYTGNVFDIIIEYCNKKMFE